jgi:2-polyprenyl-3-methyl-5-hydroxy-6-metoxy-1,4-benzoquinol methylase
MLVSVPGPKALFNLVIRQEVPPRPLAVLEAGGGSRTNIDLARLDVREITTIDISPEQLQRNSYADKKILGDLQAHDFLERYDLIVIYDVLEHLERADQALARLAAACGDGALLVVGSPNLHSFSGIATRFTPHWFHVFFYRRVLNRAEAGEPGHPPFPTHYHPVIRPDALKRFLEQRGFDCVLLTRYEGRVYARTRQQRPLVGALLGLATGLVNAVTPKRYDTRHGDYHAIFRKRAVAVG